MFSRRVPIRFGASVAQRVAISQRRLASTSCIQSRRPCLPQKACRGGRALIAQGWGPPLVGWPVVCFWLVVLARADRRHVMCLSVFQLGGAFIWRRFIS